MGHLDAARDVDMLFTPNCCKVFHPWHRVCSGYDGLSEYFTLAPSRGLSLFGKEPFMFARKGPAVVALSAILACGGLVRGADTSGSSNLQSNQPIMLQDAPEAAAPAAPAPAPPTPLMAGLEKIGVGKTLEDMNIHIGGYVEGSDTFDANHPDTGNGGGAQSDGYITGRAFDVEQESII